MEYFRRKPLLDTVFLVENFSVRADSEGLSLGGTMLLIHLFTEAYPPPLQETSLLRKHVFKALSHDVQGTWSEVQWTSFMSRLYIETKTSEQRYISSCPQLHCIN
jgi:hypothetical protein